MESKGVKGVVTRVGAKGVWVAVESSDDGEERVDWGKRVWIVRLADEVTFKRYVSEIYLSINFQICILLMVAHGL